MWPRISIVAGLLVGVAVAGLVIGGILFLGPAPTPPPTVPPVASAAPSAGPSTTAGSASPVASVLPASPSPSPEASSSTGPSASPASVFHVGEPAPALVLPKVGGGTIDLADLKGSPVWVTFMGTDCPPCQDEFPLMNGFAARYAEVGLVVVAVDVKEDEAAAAAFAKSLDTTFPMAIDADGSAADAWGAYDLPVHYWIGADGIVRDGALGGIGPDIMARGVASILPGVDVQP